MSVKIMAQLTLTNFSQYVVEVSPQRILYSVLPYHYSRSGEMFDLPLPWTYVLVSDVGPRLVPSGITCSHVQIANPTDRVGTPPLLGLTPGTGTFCSSNLFRVRARDLNDKILAATGIALSSAGIKDRPYTGYLEQMSSFHALATAAGSFEVSRIYSYWESLSEFPGEIALNDSKLWVVNSGNHAWKWLESPVVLVD